MQSLIPTLSALMSDLKYFGDPSCIDKQVIFAQAHVTTTTRGWSVYIRSMNTTEHLSLGSRRGLPSCPSLHSRFLPSRPSLRPPLPPAAPPVTGPSVVICFSLKKIEVGVVI